MCALAVDAAARFRGHELSALSLTAACGLLAVGDSSFRLTVGTSAPLSGRTRSGSLRELVAALSDDPSEGSQWERVATNRHGMVFVLQEHAGEDRPSHVFVFSSTLDALAAVIALHVPEGDGSWRRAWRADPNARGEAVVLLRDGHLLVLKQKDPIRLIEFGPRGSAARGLQARQLAGPSVGQLPTVRPGELIRYEPLASWKLDVGGERPLKSVNDAAVAGGELYVLSRSSRRIAHVVADRRRVSVAKAWKVSREIECPEGLVVLEDRTPIVADDQAKTASNRENVFRLEPLPDRGGSR